MAYKFSHQIVNKEEKNIFRVKRTDCRRQQ